MTRTPDRSAAQVQKALRAGCSPQEVQEAVFLIATYNMANRVADAYAYPPDALHPYETNAPLPMLACPKR